MSELVQERATRIARDELIEKLRADNVHILEDDEVAAARRLSELYEDKERKTLLSGDVEAHKACSGHAAQVVKSYFDSEPRVVYWCRYWKTSGHVASSASSNGTAARKGRRTTAQKAENGRVIRNNKKWLAAIPVRRKKLAELLALDELPARVQHHMALATYEGAVEHTAQSKRLAYELLGFSTNGGRQVKLATKLRRATADRATLINLAMLLASFEVAYDLKHKKDTWRRPTDNDRVYFQLLHDLWGPKLPKNIAERLVLNPDADKKDWPHLQAAAAPAVPEPDTDADNDADDDQDNQPACQDEDVAEDELGEAELTEEPVAA